MSEFCTTSAGYYIRLERDRKEHYGYKEYLDALKRGVQEQSEELLAEENQSYYQTLNFALDMCVYQQESNHNLYRVFCYTVNSGYSHNQASFWMCVWANSSPHTNQWEKGMGNSLVILDGMFSMWMLDLYLMYLHRNLPSVPLYTHHSFVVRFSSWCHFVPTHLCPWGWLPTCWVRIQILTALWCRMCGIVFCCRLAMSRWMGSLLNWFLCIKLLGSFCVISYLSQLQNIMVYGI